MRLEVGDKIGFDKINERILLLIIRVNGVSFSLMAVVNRLRTAREDQTERTSVGQSADKVTGPIEGLAITFAVVVIALECKDFKEESFISN